MLEPYIIRGIVYDKGSPVVNCAVKITIGSLEATTLSRTGGEYMFNLADLDYADGQSLTVSAKLGSKAGKASTTVDKAASPAGRLVNIDLKAMGGIHVLMHHKRS